MSLPWFRFYEETLDDPKVQKLEPEMFKHWVNVLCLAARYGGVLPCEEDCAFALRIPHGVSTVLSRLVDAGLLDRLQGGPDGYRHAPHSWNKRQYKSDTSTERVKRFRSVSETVIETPPETEAETETEKNNLTVVPKPAKRRTRLSEDYEPGERCKITARGKGFTKADWTACLAEFKSFWIGDGRVKADWDQTFCNSILKWKVGGKINGAAQKSTVKSDFEILQASIAARRATLVGRAGERDEGGGDDLAALPGLRENTA